MGRFLLRRAVESLVALFLASLVVFLGVRSLPGDPALAISGEGRDPTVNAAIRERYGLDEPVPVQRLGDVGAGDSGLLPLLVGADVKEHAAMIHHRQRSGVPAPVQLRWWTSCSP